MNINIGGTKNWRKISPTVQRHWQILDVAGKPDFYYNINSGERLPFDDNSVDNFYSSMTLEHVYPDKLPFLLKEIYRCLKKKGRIRVVVPDIKIALQKYVKNDMEWLSKKSRPYRPKIFPTTKLGYLMAWFYSPDNHSRNGHNMVFDWETLEYCFRQAGFKKIYPMKCQTQSKVFKGLDITKYGGISLYLEARK